MKIPFILSVKTAEPEGVFLEDFWINIPFFDGKAASEYNQVMPQLNYIPQSNPHHHEEETQKQIPA